MFKNSPFLESSLRSCSSWGRNMVRKASRWGLTGGSGLLWEEEITHSQMLAPGFNSFLRISDLEIEDIIILGPVHFARWLALPGSAKVSRKQDLAPWWLRRKAEKLWQRKASTVCFLPSCSELAWVSQGQGANIKWHIFLPLSPAHPQTQPPGNRRKEMHWPDRRDGQAPGEGGASTSFYGFSGTSSSYPFQTSPRWPQVF